MHPKLQETLSKYSTIILVGGGTGGHVQPIVSVIQYFKDSKNPTLQQSNILWIGGKNSQEEQAARENDVEFSSIPTFKLATTRSPKIFLYPFILIRGIFEARKILGKVADEKQDNGGSEGETVWAKKITWKWWAEQEGASFSTTDAFGTFGNKSTDIGIWKGRVAVFSKGWPWSVAVGIAAWSLGIPLYIHESDTIPGRSNRILGKIATRIFLGFDSAKKYFDPNKCETIGQILSPIFSVQHSNIPTFQHSIFWKTDKKHLLAICGSQWSRAIFEELLKNLETILKENEIILILGKLNTNMRKDFETIIKDSKTPRLQDSIQLLDWISQEDLAHLIHDTDIAITRGSATTLAELTSFNNSPLKINNLELIIVPLPYAADNHQYYNALEYEKLWHTFLEQKNLNQLSETLKKLWQNSQPSSI